jgi:hypothetical protein
LKEVVEAIQHDLLFANRDNGRFPLEETRVKDLLDAGAGKSYPVFVPAGQIIRLITMPHARNEENGVAGGDTERCLVVFDRPGAPPRRTRSDNPTYGDRAATRSDERADAQSEDTAQ